MNMLVNLSTALRRLENVFPGMFTGYKHNHYNDFGYPVTVTPELTMAMYQRNGIARAAIDKTIQKTWQDWPQFVQNPEAEETAQEKEIRKRLTRINFWRAAAECDRRQLLSGYSGMILRFADGRPFDQPVGATKGIEGLVEAIPVWATQMKVSKWITDEKSPDYGKPAMFQFRESPVGTEMNGKPARNVDIHPSRFVVWSEDGTIDCESALKPGYNNLMDIEKVIGASAEGFYKNAKQSPILEAADNFNLSEMAQTMGVSEAGLSDAMNEQVGDYLKGFDPMLLLKGMKPTFPNINLASPEQHFGVALQSFAASISMPLKILVGNQTGERASTEDARDWATTNMSRRENVVKPALISVSDRLVAAKVFKEAEWEIKWSDLTEETPQQRVDRAAKMAEIHAKFTGTGERIYLPEEIREVTGHEPLPPEDELYDDESGQSGQDQRQDDGEQQDDPKGTPKRA